MQWLKWIEELAKTKTFWAALGGVAISLIKFLEGSSDAQELAQNLAIFFSIIFLRDAIRTNQNQKKSQNNQNNDVIQKQEQ